MTRFHGRDLRKGRFSEAGRPYLVTTVTRDRRPVFRDWRNGRLLAMTLRQINDNRLAATLAWVVMPDHLHWLMVPDRAPLDAVVRRAKSCSAREINRRVGGSGPLWQKGYHDHAVRSEEDVIAIARYIVANPLRAGIVARIGEYPLWDCVYL